MAGTGNFFSSFLSFLSSFLSCACPPLSAIRVAMADANISVSSLRGIVEFSGLWCGRRSTGSDVRSRPYHRTHWSATSWNRVANRNCRKTAWRVRRADLTDTQFLHLCCAEHARLIGVILPTNLSKVSSGPQATGGFLNEPTQGGSDEPNIFERCGW